MSENTLMYWRQSALESSTEAIHCTQLTNSACSNTVGVADHIPMYHPGNVSTPKMGQVFCQEREKAMQTVSFQNLIALYCLPSPSFGKPFISRSSSIRPIDEARSALARADRTY